MVESPRLASAACAARDRAASSRCLEVVSIHYLPVFSGALRPSKLSRQSLRKERGSNPQSPLGPTCLANRPLANFASLPSRAGGGNRTRLSTLATSHLTDGPRPHVARSRPISEPDPAVLQGDHDSSRKLRLVRDGSSPPPGRLALIGRRSGASDGIRTHDPLVGNQELYR